jgi:leucyl aminopeptidase (aminopeptidase T)
MDTTWPHIAAHIVERLGVRAGELVQVRDNAGRMDALLEIALAIELRGATPLVQLVPGHYMRRMFDQAPLDYLDHWDRHRSQWAEQSDRVLVLGGSEPGFGAVPGEGMVAWQGAAHRLTRREEERELPYMLAAIPNEAQAQKLGMDLQALDNIVLPALVVDARTLRAEIERALVEGGRTVTVRSGAGHVLHLHRGDRPWLSGRGGNDGDNLPAGSIYTTVLEGETEGSLWLPRAAGATDVTLHFMEGRIARIEAASGAEDLEAMLDAHSGEPRRVSHVGVGLNPHLRQPIGWTLVDEHVRGAFFIALGENRYMGGQNESSLNIDFCNPGATVEVDGRVLVSEGRLAV